MSRRRAPAVLLLFCATAFVVLGWAVRDRPTRLDERLHAWALSHRSGTVGLAKIVTDGGSATAVVIGTALIAALVMARPSQPRRVWLALLLVVAVVASVTLRFSVSQWFHRARPSPADWATPATGWSFPSGHTNAAALGAGVTAWVLCSVLTARWLRVLVGIAAILYAGSVAWSRVWLGVHWPTDLVGGWLYAGAWLSALWLVADRLTGRPQRAPSAG